MLIVLTARLELEIPLALAQHGNIAGDENRLGAEFDSVLELLLSEVPIRRDVKLPEHGLSGRLGGKDLVDRGAGAGRNDLDDVVFRCAAGNVELAVRVTEASQSGWSDKDRKRLLHASRDEPRRLRW